jgi:hypothetical protein
VRKRVRLGWWGGWARRERRPPVGAERARRGVDEDRGHTARAARPSAARVRTAPRPPPPQDTARDHTLSTREVGAVSSQGAGGRGPGFFGRPAGGKKHKRPAGRPPKKRKGRREDAPPGRRHPSTAMYGALPAQCAGVGHRWRGRRGRAGGRHTVGACSMRARSISIPPLLPHGTRPRTPTHAPPLTFIAGSRSARRPGRKKQRVPTDGARRCGAVVIRVCPARSGPAANRQ